MPVYGSREAPIPGITGDLVVKSARDRGHSSAQYIETRESVNDVLEKELRDGDVLITMGAGDVCRFGERFLDARRSKASKGETN